MLHVGKCCADTCCMCCEGCAKGWSAFCTNLTKAIHTACGEYCKCCASCLSGLTNWCAESFSNGCKYCIENCTLCPDYAAGPFTCCSLFCAILYFLPSLVWFALAIAGYASVGEDCWFAYGQESLLLVQCILYLLGTCFLIWTVRALGVSYTRAYDAREEAVEKGEKPRERLMCCAVLGFIGYDWGFLIYSFIFCFSMAFDIAVIVVGAIGL